MALRNRWARSPSGRATVIRVVIPGVKPDPQSTVLMISPPRCSASQGISSAGRSGSVVRIGGSGFFQGTGLLASKCVDHGVESMCDQPLVDALAASGEGDDLDDRGGVDR